MAVLRALRAAAAVALLLPGFALRGSLAQPSGAGLDVTLGEEVGLEPGDDIDPATVNAVIQGAGRGSPESLYFLGLFRLYGMGMAKDELRALQSFRRAAEAGHPFAQFSLGTMLFSGLGGMRDLRSARAWLETAASNGDHPDSDFMLGRVYYELNAMAAATSDAGAAGVTEDYVQLAEDAFGRAIEHGADRVQARSKYYLGVMAEYGLGSTPSAAAAVEHYTAACAGDVLDACYHLGLIYSYGRGVQQDHATASTYFKRCAEQGHASAMYYLGIFAWQGLSRDVDYMEAALYFEKAAKFAPGGSDIQEKAAAARDELREAIKAARRVNMERLARYDHGQLEDASGFSVYDLEADDFATDFAAAAAAKGGASTQ
uniref:Uncharacterized protein n=1 Tax=Phaeomonas parva TaxID=124430 RepID=A0A6U4KSW9_9STRA|mmetsp:Transcript_7114/g.20800  ORF Transcript_7114/g.20800 Transcript_7114/m.20800 type:complete len:373 (+) Transcript_7114:84-1202(+)